jgi:formylmethanofuran dehydrogenase subunit E
MESNKRRNAGEAFRQRVILPEIRDGKRCKSCFEPITDETKWFKGEQLCDDCKKKTPCQ